ncbi:hypothetical protein QVD17_12374 [Tagetes erecta]|uniref:Uncharacterized protein n=1 Tax=Tagetes erecta TaxID=13708 RepID=A0AAD8KUT6_TARER|nr:hypothetical protein QVD17_12374 [Tagetes erecta]
MKEESKKSERMLDLDHERRNKEGHHFRLDEECVSRILYLNHKFERDIDERMLDLNHERRIKEGHHFRLDEECVSRILDLNHEFERDLRDKRVVEIVVVVVEGWGRRWMG